MKAWWILFLAMTVLAADSMAGGTGDNYNPYLDKDTFYERTADGYIYNDGYIEYNDNSGHYDGNDGYVDDGNYNNGQQYEEPVYQEPDYETPNYVENRYSRVYQETYQQCDPRGNPHSYACAKATFAGQLAGTNPRDPNDFVLSDIKVRELRGDWVLVTYANPSGNVGDEFYMATNAASQTQPMGVYNVNTRPVPRNEISVWVERDGLSFSNWQGQQLQTSSIERLTDKTFRVMMSEGNYLHQFTCRDFNRSNKHHLFCAWDVEVPGQGWVHHGYMGFLSRTDWNDFLRNGVRN